MPRSDGKGVFPGGDGDDDQDGRTPAQPGGMGNTTTTTTGNDDKKSRTFQLVNPRNITMIGF